MEDSRGRKSDSWLSKFQKSSDGKSEGNNEAKKKDNKPSWKVDTPQVAGRRYEKKAVKNYGGKPTPMSGAGNIKYDGLRKAVVENEASIIEVKKVDKNFTLKSDELLKSLRYAQAQNKEVVWHIKFGNKLLAEIWLTKEI